MDNLGIIGNCSIAARTAAACDIGRIRCPHGDDTADRRTTIER